MKYSAVASTGVLVGSAHGVGAVDESDEDAEDADDPEPTTIDGAMFPYQFAPGARVSVVERELDWLPRGVDDAYRSHVVEYDHARSLRAFLFTNAEDDLPDDRSLAFDATPQSVPTSIERNLVGVAAQTVDR